MVDSRYYRAQVTIPHDNALPKDALTNTYAFQKDVAGDRDLAAVDIAARLEAFYDGLVTILSSQYNWAASTVKIYDYEEDRPRFPFWESTLSIATVGSSQNDWPAEVAMCVSFEGEKISGFNMKRRRGRVYIGPFQVGTGDYPTTSTSLADLVAGQADTHLLHPTSPVVDWCVYSPSTHFNVPVGEKITPEMEEDPLFLEASFVKVVKMWVDDAWDTQRRRGVSPSYRKSYDL